MTVPQTPFALCINCEAVFPEAPDTSETFRTLLAGMDRSQVLLWCARINEKLSDQFGPPALAKLNPFQRFQRRQQLLVRHFFTAEEIGRITSFFQAEAPKSPVPILPTVFFRGQVLELLRWACIYCPNLPETCFDAPSSRTPLAKALLIAGTFWNRRIYQKAKSDSEKAAQGIERFLVTFRRSRDQDTSALDLTRALSRGRQIFCEYFPIHYARHTKRDFTADFTGATGLSIEQYYDCWSSLMGSMMTRVVKQYFNLFAGPEFNPNTFASAAIPEFGAIFSQFMTVKSQPPEKLLERILGGQSPDGFDPLGRFSIVPLASCPIVRLKDDLAVIPDMDSFAQSASLGPLFHILRSAGSSISANAMFGAFGDAFHEYCAAILHRMFPTTANLADRALCPFVDKVGNEIADACLDYGDALAVFETKSVFIDKSAENGDPSEYLEALTGRYVSGEERKQGVAQLAAAIDSIASGSRVPNHLALASVNYMIPVLLVRDPLMESPLHTRYLAEEFVKALVPDDVPLTGNMKKGRFSITPLIVMTVETLEDLETSGMHLRKLLVDYSEDCLDRVQSLRNYLAISEYQGKIRYSDRLREETSQQLERLKSYFM